MVTCFDVCEILEMLSEASVKVFLDGGWGVPAATMLCEDLADADDTAVKRFIDVMPDQIGHLNIKIHLLIRPTYWGLSFQGYLFFT